MAAGADACAGDAHGEQPAHWGGAKGAAPAVAALFDAGVEPTP